MVRASRWVDRAYGWFNRRRSQIVVAWAGDRFYTAFNDLAYRQERAHREGADPRRLRDWEQRFVRHLPPPPARILVGGAGTGREAWALGEMGYEVVAFDPAPALVAEMSRSSVPGVEILRGGYEDLPVLQSTEGAEVDLRIRPAFDGILAGWGSFSHLRSDAACVGALSRLADLTAGPILLSYLPGPDGETPQAGFSVYIGFFRQLSGAHVRRFASEAGLEVVSLREDENWPQVVLRRADRTAR